MTTLYATLGVQADATLDDIKRAYRRAAMKWHPDRNPGRESEAHAVFQEVRAAYAILSDAEQRQIYDDVFEREMQRWQAEHAAQEAQEREAQEQAMRAAQEHYEQMVSLAMRFADAGHNRDVVFGVLLGHDCEAELAARIADSVWALHQSRNATAQEVEEPEPETPHKSQSNAFESFWHGLFRFHS